MMLIIKILLILKLFYISKSVDIEFFCISFALMLHQIIKFIYSEKATTFFEIFILLLPYVVPVKSKVKIFVVFSEYMNFNDMWWKLWKSWMHFANSIFNWSRRSYFYDKSSTQAEVKNTGRVDQKSLIFLKKV